MGRRSTHGGSHLPRVLYFAVSGLGREALELYEPPTLLRLMDEGSWCDLPSTNPPLEPPAWMSMHSGANSGEHGVFGLFSMRDPEEYGATRSSPYLSSIGQMRCLRFWERAAMSGMQVVVRDMMMSLPRLENRSDVGFVALDDPSILGGSPADQRVPDVSRRRRGGAGCFSDAMWSLGRKCIPYSDLALDRSIDLLCLGMHELDGVLHAYGLSSPEARAVVAVMDDLIGLCVAAAGDDTVSLLVSDHGVAEYDGCFSVPCFLERRGWMVREQGRIDFDRTQVYPTCCGDPSRVDWEFGLYANTRGRQSRGIVAPEDAAELLRVVADALQEEYGFECCANREYYRGPLAHCGPDLLIHVGEQRLVPLSTYNAAVEITLGSIANHSSFGISAAVGPCAAVAPCNGDDVAPFMLRALGVPVEPMPLLVDDALAKTPPGGGSIVERLRILGHLN